MPVAALILGILGLVVFCWLGPFLGFLVSGFATASAGELVTWPLWLIGGLIGGLVPLSALVIGLAGMKQEDSKGICVAGMVMGVVAALLGLGITAGVAVLGQIGEEVMDRVQDSAVLPDPDDAPDEDYGDMMRQMNDPEFQKKLQEQLKAASAAGATPSPQPREMPSNLPAEAPPQP